MADDINPWDVNNFNLTAQSEYLKKYGPARAAARMRDAKAIAPLMKPSPGAARVFILKSASGGNPAPRPPILGFTGEGPFMGNERFMLAPTPMVLRFPAIAAMLSAATALYAPTADSAFVLTADPDQYLADGSGVICTVTFGTGSQIGAFAWGDPVQLPAATRLWIIAPPVADVVLGGVQILFRGDAV